MSLYFLLKDMQDSVLYTFRNIGHSFILKKYLQKTCYVLKKVDYKKYL